MASRWPRAVLPLLCIGTACSQNSGEPAVSDDPDARRGGMSVTLQSEDAVGSVRPELSISCGEGDPFLMLKLVRVPASPPPLRGVFGIFKVDDGEPQRVELGWGTQDVWVIRDDPIEAALVRRLLQGRSVYFLGPEGATDQPVRWDMHRLGSRLDSLRRACG